MEAALIIVLAVALDMTLGDPPNAIHPVAWMGKVIGWLEKGGGRGGHAFQFVYGMCLSLVTIAVFVIPAYFLIVYVENINSIVYIIAAAIILKLTFSIKGLQKAALKVKKLLEADKLDEARLELRSLVKRNTADLPEPLLISATVESVAENASDSFAAPLFYFLLLGIPGAVGYRAVNTLDTMIGYHGKYEYLGKFAARLDDVVNYIPARLTALLIALAALIMRKNCRSAWRTAIEEHGKTESPNAGWPMAAMAGALDVRLEKAGFYQLGKEKAPLTAKTIDKSIGILLTASFTWALIGMIIEVMKHVIKT